MTWTCFQKIFLPSSRQENGLIKFKLKKKKKRSEVEDGKLKAVNTSMNGTCLVFYEKRK